MNQPSTPNNVFIIISGASGHMPSSQHPSHNNIQTIIQSTFPSDLIIGPLIHANGDLLLGSVGVTPAVIKLVSETVTKASADYPKTNLYICTQSYGGRVAIHMMLQKFENTNIDAYKGELYPDYKNDSPFVLPPNFAGIISCGYPLINHMDGDKRTSDRTIPFHYPFPSSLRCLFIIGSQDHKCSASALNGARSKMNVESEAWVVEGGGHNCFNIKGVSDEERNESVEGGRERIRRFVEDGR